MKTSSLATTITLISATLLPAQGENFIRQIQTLNGQSIVFDIQAPSDKGQVTSRPLASEFSIFQLYTTIRSTVNGRDTSTLKKLDEKTIGTFVPTASFTFKSEDPHSPPRTRADRPYGLTISVSGLLTTPTAPPYSQKIEISRSYKVYDPTTFAPFADNSQQGEYTDSFSFSQNGSFTDDAISARLPSELPTKASGEETFTVRLDPSALPNTSALATSTIQIWPVANAGIVGLEEGKKYGKIPPATTLVLDNLYPTSTTYAQIYKGPRALGTIGTVIPSSVVSYGQGTQVPQKALLALSDEDIAKALDEDGTYTMEILTVTPFNGGAPELMTDVTFEIDQSLSIRAQITTLK